VWSTGADYGEFGGVSVETYVKDPPVNRVKSDALVAYEMNGAPLAPEHGFPARLVVPGFYGTNSVKWLTRMTLAEARAPGPFTTRWYNDPVEDDRASARGRTVPVWAIAPQSVIVAPAPTRPLLGFVQLAWRSPRCRSRARNRRSGLLIGGRASWTSSRRLPQAAMIWQFLLPSSNVHRPPNANASQLEGVTGSLRICQR
jgi:DMSO/TMAO reductase YedYZ molybdopterin-dependent catalytic subunit